MHIIRYILVLLFRCYLLQLFIVICVLFVCLFCRVTLVASHHAVVTINVIVYILLVDDYYYVATGTE